MTTDKLAVDADDPLPVIAGATPVLAREELRKATKA